jgi:hypothetical protein
MTTANRITSAAATQTTIKSFFTFGALSMPFQNRSAPASHWKCCQRMIAPYKAIFQAWKLARGRDEFTRQRRDVAPG